MASNVFNYICTFCNRKYFTRIGYSFHIKTHSEETLKESEKNREESETIRKESEKNREESKKNREESKLIKECLGSSTLENVTNQPEFVMISSEDSNRNFQKCFKSKVEINSLSDVVVTAQDTDLKYTEFIQTISNSSFLKTEISSIQNSDKLNQLPLCDRKTEKENQKRRNESKL